MWCSTPAARSSAPTSRPGPPAMGACPIIPARASWRCPNTTQRLLSPPMVSSLPGAPWCGWRRITSVRPSTWPTTSSSSPAELRSTAGGWPPAVRTPERPPAHGHYPGGATPGGMQRSFCHKTSPVEVVRVFTWPPGRALRRSPRRPARRNSLHVAFGCGDVCQGRVRVTFHRQVAEADDADSAPRNPAHGVLAHQLDRLVQRHVRAGGHYRGVADDLGDWRMRVLLLRDEPDSDIPVGQDAGNGAVVQHDDIAHVTPRHQAGCLGGAFVSLDRYRVTGHDVRDYLGHWFLPWFIRTRAFRASAKGLLGPAAPPISCRRVLYPQAPDQSFAAILPGMLGDLCGAAIRLPSRSAVSGAVLDSAVVALAVVAYAWAGRIQPVEAISLVSSSAKTSLGFLNPRIRRGRSFSSSAIACR